MSDPSVADAVSPAARSAAPPGIWIVALIAFCAVLLQITLFSFVRLGDGIPDIVAAAVVAAGLWRGPLVGAVTGFCSGLLVELTSPIDSVGVFALLYLVVGVVAGRYCEREESKSLWAPLAFTVVAALFVQVGFALVQVSLGKSLDTPSFVASALVPSLILTALLTPPVLLLARRVLGRPRIVEPYALGRA